MITQHFMLDIETLSQDTRVASVVSIALVAFRPGGGIQRESLWILDPDDQPNRKADFATIQWWMKQRPEAAAHWAIPSRRTPTLQALKELSWGVNPVIYGPGTWDQAIWWGNSPNFDETIMTGLYKEFSVAPPWKFREWRDVRTIREFLKDKSFPENPNLHNPLADCRAQIELVERFYKEQGLI